MEDQASWKRNFIFENLTRLGGFPEGELPEIIFHPAPDGFNYRNRVLLRGTVSDGKVRLGYLKSGTWEQVHIDECVIADSAINEVIEAINNLNVTSLKNQKFRLELQLLPYLKAPNIIGILHTINEPNSEGNENLLPALKALPHFIFFSEANSRQAENESNISNHPVFAFEKTGEIIFHTSPGIFQQVSLKANHLLRKSVTDFFIKKQVKTLVDLFCGSGNLSIPLVKEKIKVWGFESNPTSIRVAHHNLVVNHLPPATYLPLSALEGLKQLYEQKIEVDGLILDPPRAGFKEGLDLISKIRPKWLGYVSCDPTTLARDLKELKKDYKIEEIHGFDFFPHTYHVESLVFLGQK